MQIAALAFGATLVLWAIAHCLIALVFRAVILKRTAPTADPIQVQSDRSPRVAVLMSLRGCDPFLLDTLRGLLRQEYEDFEIVCIIDNRKDPAWKVVEEFAIGHDAGKQLRFYELQQPLKSCSLKCSALVQACAMVQPDREVVVLIDADVVPHRRWLSEVVQPLSDPTIGVVTGNQWFEPTDPTIGSMLRSIWNAGAIVATAFNANPWAGTCAMRLADLRESGLIQKWQTSVVDDGPIKAAMTRLGIKVYFEPRLIMVNRDQCSASFVGRYVTRMLTWSRIYEASFINTVLHGLALLGLHAAGVLVVSIAALNREWLAVTILASSVGLANIFLFMGFLAVRNAVRHSIARRDERLGSLTIAKATRVFLLIPVCQLAHLYWTVRAMFTKQTTWRGITYRLKPGQTVEMDAYRPYVAAVASNSERTSI